MPLVIEDIVEKSILGAAVFFVLFCFVGGIGYLASGPPSIVVGCGLFISMILTVGFLVCLQIFKFIKFKMPANTEGEPSSV
jgi:hypothetical protein